MTVQLFIVDTGEDLVETSLRPYSDNWVSTEDAATILCLTRSSFASVVGQKDNYYELRRRVRGTKGKPSAKGQGWQWYVPDLIRARQIRLALRCRPCQALRIFAHTRRGDLDFLQDIDRVKSWRENNEAR